MSICVRTRLLGAASFVLLTGVLGAAPQTLPANERDRAKRMLMTLQSAIRDGYYDATFRGLDLNAHFKAAAAKLDEARSIAHAYGIIAQSLIEFGDSHTYFVPPMRPTTFEYGWVMQMVGDACYVTAVKPGSDAESKGLRAGDRILQVDGFTPARQDFWKLRYLLYMLSPRPVLKVVAQRPGDASPRPLELAAKVTQRPGVVDINIEHIEDLVRQEMHEARTTRNRFGRAGTVTVWKLSGFDFQPGDVDRLVDEAIKGASGLVLDMRGNSGGYVKTLEQLAGRFFDHDLKIADIKGRKSTKAMVARKRRTTFGGPIVVVIDAESASAAELLARVMQIEKRGIVIGDRSAGFVMQGRMIAGAIEAAQGVLVYYASVTDADLIMADGVSLEHTGVTPDERLLPTPEDLAARRDPVLARAITMLGAPIDPAAAGAMFPFEWKP